MTPKETPKKFFNFKRDRFRKNKNWFGYKEVVEAGFKKEMFTTDQLEDSYVGVNVTWFHPVLKMQTVKSKWHVVKLKKILQS